MRSERASGTGFRFFLYHLLAVPAACVATVWAWWHSMRIVGEGRQLDEGETALAVMLGIPSPDKVRIMEVDNIPNPLERITRLVGGLSGRKWVTDVDGITLDFCIYVRKSAACSMELIAHELVHVRQYEEMQAVWMFMREYVFQCLAHGYYHAPLEVEARRESARVIRQWTG